MKKRIVVLLLATLMAVTTTVGCGETAAAPSSTMNFAPADEAVCEAVEEAPASYVAHEYAASDEAAGYADVARPSKSNSSSAKTQSVREYAEAETWYDADEEAYVGRWPYDEIKNPGEDYTVNDENGFMSTTSNPLSTFGADVDTASYSNMRRMVEQGYGLYDFPEGSIRTEELVNYFSYDYAKPEKGQVFGVDATISDCPWNRDSKLMILGVNTETLDEKDIPDSNIVFLVDVSGSMNGSKKLPLLKEAMELLVENLSDNDRVSIVTYASGTDVVLEGMAGNKKTKINRAFNSLRAGGATNGEGGIELAYEIAEKHFIKGGNNRVIIASDGDFNVGASSQSDLYDLISEKKDSGIFLSTLGFGMGNYSDTTMETLADSGNGNYAYIDSLAEAKKVLVDEMSSTLYTVAKDTKLQVEFNPALVSSYRLIGYENRQLAAQDFKDDTKDGGELGSGHQVTVMYEIKLADFADNGTELKYQDSTLSKKGAKGDEWCTLSVAYKNPDKDKSNYLEFPIGVNNYTKNPSDDYKFATAVAEFGMALSGSSYLKDMTREEALDQCYRTVGRLSLDDVYREQFMEIVEIVCNGNNYNSWYE